MEQQDSAKDSDSQRDAIVSIWVVKKCQSQLCQISMGWHFTDSWDSLTWIPDAVLGGTFHALNDRRPYGDTPIASVADGSYSGHTGAVGIWSMAGGIKKYCRCKFIRDVTRGAALSLYFSFHFTFFQQRASLTTTVPQVNPSTFQRLGPLGELHMIQGDLRVIPTIK